jgi:hypothetical protein
VVVLEAVEVCVVLTGEGVVLVVCAVTFVAVAQVIVAAIRQLSFADLINVPPLTASIRTSTIAKLFEIGRTAVLFGQGLVAK